MASTILPNNATVAPDTQTLTTVVEPPETLETVADAATSSLEKKWAGWPGECVFRLIVPVLKVGSIIGRKGDIIKKMCEHTKARIRVLDAPLGTSDRIVLIHGKEETKLALSPAMDAVIQVFKRINEFPENEGESTASLPFSSIKLLVPSTQAMSLIGKQGSLIKSIQESTGCSVRVLSCDEVSANSDQRFVDMQGEAIKVLKALEAVLGHLRKFLVDRSVLPLFEMTNNVAEASHSQHELRARADYSTPMRRETLFVDREPLQRESHLTSHGFSLYGRDPTALSLALARTAGPIVTQMAQTMQIPLVSAEDIIGVGGKNIAYIRRTSGALLTVQESVGLPDEIIVEIKGTTSQVQTAEQLIHDCVYSRKESSIPSSYVKMEPGLRSSYSQLENSMYSGGQPYDRYGASGLGGGYPGSYRL